MFKHFVNKKESVNLSNKAVVQLMQCVEYCINRGATEKSVFVISFGL